MLNLELSKQSKKFIKMNKEIGNKFLNKFFELTNDLTLLSNTQNYKKLSGFQNRWRLRIGDYRAIFEIMNDKLIIYILKIDSRGDIYKK